MTTESPLTSPAATALREAAFRLILTDGAPRLSAVSDGVQALLGYPAADFRSGQRALPSLIHPEDRDVADALFSPASPGNEGECNLRLRPAGGRILCVKGRYRREVTAGGVVLELLLQDAKCLPRTMADAHTSPMFAAMMENTDDYIYFKDRNHVFTGASQTLVALCSPATRWTDLLGQTDYDVFPEEFADLYYRLEKQIFAGLTVAHEEQKTLGKDGKAGWVDNRKYPIRDASGVLIGLYGIARDITERRQAEDNARQSHELLANLTRLVPGVVYQYRLFPDGRSAFPYSSPGMNDIYEVKPEEVREDATPVFGRLHPEDYGRVGDLIQESARTLRTFNCEFRVLLPRQGLRWRWSQAQPERMEDGGTLWHGIISDITERKQAEAVFQQNQASADRMRRALLSTLEDQKRAEAAVREREARYGAMVGSIADAIISADHRGRITGWNPGAEHIFGYPESEILSRFFARLLPPRYHKRQVADLARAVAEGTPRVIGTTMELVGRRKDGREFPLKISLSEWQIDGQKFFTAIVRDITEEKAAATNLAARMEELRRWQGATLGREGRVLELEREINALHVRHGEAPKYSSVLKEGQE